MEAETTSFGASPLWVFPFVVAYCPSFCPPPLSLFLSVFTLSPFPPLWFVSLYLCTKNRYSFSFASLFSYQLFRTFAIDSVVRISNEFYTVCQMIRILLSDWMIDIFWIDFFSPCCIPIKWNSISLCLCIILSLYFLTVTIPIFSLFITYSKYVYLLWETSIFSVYSWNMSFLINLFSGYK